MIRKRFLFTSLLLISQIQLFSQEKRDIQKEIDSLLNIKDTIALNNKLDALKNGSEDDLKMLLYYNYAKNLPMQPVTELGIKRFPNGDMAFDNAVNQMASAPNLDRKLQLMDSLKIRFPKKDLGEPYAILTGAYANLGQFDKAMSYLHKTTGGSRMTAWATFAYLSNPAINNKAEQIVDQTLRSGKIDKPEKIMLLKLKLNFLEKKQNYRQAATIAKTIIDMLGSKDENANGHYAILLSKSGQYKAAFPYLQEAIENGTEDQEAMTAYRKCYQAIYPGRNVDAHLDSINQTLLAKYKAQYENNIAKELVKVKAPDFELLDADSAVVSPKDFKGKIMVIDFWATWCGPCKAALPGMQQLVNMYKADTTVKFLFIHTAEQFDDTFASVKAKSQAYFKSHHYSLPLYLDLKDKASNENKVAKNFQVKGIPHKVIIDSEGFIRLTSVGFSGSTPEIVAEMDAAIKEIKKLH